MVHAGPRNSNRCFPAWQAIGDGVTMKQLLSKKARRDITLKIKLEPGIQEAKGFGISIRQKKKRGSLWQLGGVCVE